MNKMNLISAATLPEYIDTARAAMILKTTRRRIQSHCKELGFKKLGRDYQLSADQVDQIYQVRLLRPIGRPKKT